MVEVITRLKQVERKVARLESVEVDKWTDNEPLADDGLSMGALKNIIAEEE